MKIVYGKVKYYEKEVHSDEHDEVLRSLEALKSILRRVRIEKDYSEYGWTLRALNCNNSYICSFSGNWEKVSEEEREVEKRFEVVFVEHNDTTRDDLNNFKLGWDL